MFLFWSARIGLSYICVTWVLHARQSVGCMRCLLVPDPGCDAVGVRSGACCCAAGSLADIYEGDGGLVQDIWEMGSMGLINYSNYGFFWYYSTVSAYLQRVRGCRIS